MSLPLNDTESSRYVKNFKLPRRLLRLQPLHSHERCRMPAATTQGQSLRASSGLTTAMTLLNGPPCRSRPSQHESSSTNFIVAYGDVLELSDLLESQSELNRSSAAGSSKVSSESRSIVRASEREVHQQRSSPCWDKFLYSRSHEPGRRHGCAQT